MQDPLSGAKQASSFIIDLMDARAAEAEVESELEKAKDEDEDSKDDAGGSSKRKVDVTQFNEQAQDLYRQCMLGMEMAGHTGDTAQRICALQARDFDKAHPDGMDIPTGEGDEPDVEKNVSTAGMTADLGSPSADVALTDADTGRKKRRLGQSR